MPVRVAQGVRARAGEEGGSCKGEYSTLLCEDYFYTAYGEATIGCLVPGLVQNTEAIHERSQVDALVQFYQ